jgi:Co/Zn/Cd efflux system component
MSIAPDSNATENYGPPQPPYGPPAPPAAPQSTSGLSIAGLILAFLAPLIGLILSIVALVQIKKTGQKGKGLAIAGIIVSILEMAAIGAIIAVVVAAVPNVTTVADRGCVDGKAAITNNVPSGADPAAAKVTFQKAIDEMHAAVAKSKDDDVKAALNAVADDYTQLVQAMDSGDVSKIDEIQ